MCEIELTFSDANMRGQNTTVLRESDDDVNVRGDIVTLLTKQLTTNRFYQVSIKARNIVGRTSEINIISEFSTH